MKALFILLSAFCISVFAIKFTSHKYDIALAARIAMSVMLLFTAIGHFALSRGMAMMIPGFIPFKLGLVYLTGILEFAAAVGLLIPDIRTMTGWFLIIFFILVLPANINATMKHLEYQTGTYKGYGPGYLWFRIPAQIIFILWVYFSLG